MVCARRNIEEEAIKLREHIAVQLRENETELLHGYATLTGWQGPKRCFISVTNTRIIVVRLNRRYSEIQNMSDIHHEDIVSLQYRLGLLVRMLISKVYNQKPLTPRLYIGAADGKRLALAFDDQEIAKSILSELEKRIKK